MDAIDDEIDELEDGIEVWPAEQIRRRISTLRHDLLHVRRTLSLRRATRSTGSSTGASTSARAREISRARSRLDFADAYDKLLRAMDGLDLSRDLLASARDYHQAKIANDQNEVMKRLTVIASVLLLPTFIVGLYGQNFRHIPELAWDFGYGWSWGWITRDDGAPACLLPVAGLDRRAAHGPTACRRCAASTRARLPDGAGARPG